MVAGGKEARGTVKLGSPAPAPELVVSLSSDAPNTASVPAQVSIPGGASSASFQIKTQPVTQTTHVRISASVGNVSKEAALTVTDGK
jgi:hypothetical protein